MKKTALISVFNKEGIVEFAKDLVSLGYSLLSSGGTAKVLMEAGLTVTDVADVTGMPAILSHRVVTLHPKIFGGILAEDTPEHRAELLQYEIPWIDLVCVDFYPLKDAINAPESTKEKVIERTDIGGPTMVRAAAKARRIVVCDVNDRARVISWMKEGEQNREAFLEMLAARAEFLVADYVLTSSKYHGENKYEGFLGELLSECKYGENAYQQPARVYTTQINDPLSIKNFTLASGTPLSYNNWCDIDRMLQSITHIAAGFDINYGTVPHIAIAVKHGNICGASVGDNTKEVLEKMIMGDPRAIFGGLVMTNFAIDDALAETLLSYNMPEGARRILDGIAAPSFSEGAIAVLKRKGDKCRFIENSALATLSKNSLDTNLRFRYARGGFFVQPNYTFVLNLQQSELAKHGSATQQQEHDMILASSIGSTSNSNTITLVRNGQLIGNGVGQQDRVGAANLALLRAQGANHETKDAVAYSDSFFPFPDAPELLISFGISAIISTSGSVNDTKAIEVCANKNVPLYLIPDALGRGFYAH